MLDVAKLKQKSDAAAASLGLSPEETKEIISAAHAVYEEIGADLPPDNKRRGTCKRDTIVEVVLDAGRLHQHLARGHVPASATVLKAVSHETPYETVIDLVGPAFPYEHYEVSGEAV